MPDNIKSTSGGIAVTPDGTSVYLVDGGDTSSGRVLVINTTNNSIKARIPIGLRPSGAL
jgi:YVTN family beta-propeller protein